MTAILLALSASAAYGSSDFAAGLAARRVAPIAIAWWSHVAGAIILVALASVLAMGDMTTSLLVGAAAGAIVSIGLILFYSALAQGSVSVVAPIGAAGVTVPLVVGVAGGDMPSVIALVGLAAVAGGVIALSSTRAADEEPVPPSPGARPGCPEEQGRLEAIAPVPAALLAAASFGTAFVLIDLASPGTGEALWVAAGLQTGGLAALALIVARGTRAGVRVERAALFPIAATGLLAASGDVALAVAFAVGDLSAVSVLGSLDSVVSVMLGQLVLHEQIARLQAAGVASALVGATLIAAG